MLAKLVIYRRCREKRKSITLHVPRMQNSPSKRKRDAEKERGEKERKRAVCVCAVCVYECEECRVRAHERTFPWPVIGFVMGATRESLRFPKN